MAVTLSTLDLLVSTIFTVVVAYRWYARRRMHSLLWAWALLVWTVAVAAEVAAARQGVWTPTTYRIYYAFGALMVAAWLGAGSLYLTAGRRLAGAYIWIVLALSVIGTALIFTYPIDPAVLSVTDSLGFVEVSVFPFIPVRIFIVISNILGSAAFIGAALYSVWVFLRYREVPGSYVAGVALIAVGGLVAAGAHSIGVLGGPGLFRISELVAIILIFVGYLVSSRRPPKTAAASGTMASASEG
ncbi:MAG TPA: hypothetical protein VLL77_05790 [Anaerolineales bacterium]|nr:hypothetical protein [Anaerolineales bacterium]